MMLYNEVLETCQICLCDMTRADQLFPLNCPTKQCSFNLCLECIISMLLSEADGYQLASDGSNQLKFRVRCPNCCVKYTLPRRPKQSIVPFVATLRQAYEVRDVLQKSEENLGPALLERKNLFLKYTTVQELKEAVDIYDEYLEMVDKHAAGRLDMADFLGLPRLKVPWADASLFQQGEEEYLTMTEQQLVTQLLCSGDPDTVAQGVASLQAMTKRHTERISPLQESREDTAETEDQAVTLLHPHDYIAQIFCGATADCTTSNSCTNTDDYEVEDDNSILRPPSLVSPTKTMTGPTNTMATQSTFDEPLSAFQPGRNVTYSNEELMQRMFGVPEPAAAKTFSRAAHSFRSMRERTSSRLKGIAPPEQVTPDNIKLPLPYRMPRGSEIPVYNPHGWYKAIKFDKTDAAKLAIQSFRGSAKKSGLRTGDVLTHVQSESVLTLEQFDQKMLSLYTQQPYSQCSLVVNADREVADHLKTRSLLMRLLLRR
eukprot:scaffold609_cov170-Amphora_coffeaeformis.AAC.41